jgi:hypothetical protein
VTSTTVDRTLPLAAILVALLMFMGSVPSLDMAAMLSYSDSEKVETEIFEFHETIYHESEHELFASHKTLFTTPQFPLGADYYECLAIQYFAWNWDCRDLDGNPDGPSGHYLEHDQYSLNVGLVYQYKIEYSGSVEIETRTTWSYGSSPQTTMTVIDSSETMIVSAKASFRLNLYRHYVGPSGSQSILRNVLPFDYPALTPSDIDGDGNHVWVGGQKFYKWDRYSVFDWEYNQQDELGSKHILTGYKTVAEIDLLDLASRYGGSLVPIAKAFSYILEINFQINLNLRAEVTNYAQLFLGMSSVQTIRNNFNNPSQKAAYNCALSSSNYCIKMVSGQGTQVNGFLGFYHQIQTSESYSADIVVDHANNAFALMIWAIFTDGNPKKYTLSEGHFATSSIGYEFTETSETISIDLSGYVPAPPNNAPTVSLQNSQIQGSNLFANIGDSVQLSVSAYDADGDSMSGSLSWGDGTTSDWSASIPNSASHTYTSTGIYYVGAEVQDDVASSYSAQLTVIVTPDTSALESLDIVSSNSMIDEGDTITFTLSSSNPTADLEFVFDDDRGNSETIQPPSGELSSVQRQITYNTPGDYTPNIQAYDSQANLLGYQEVSLRVLPDFGNGTANPSLFQLIGDGVLIVIDDNGYELSTAERTADYQNINTSCTALLQAVAKVGQIRNKSMEIFIVGDTDLDGVVDSLGADGPGLNILRHYSTVVWTTGADYEPLTEFDEAVLRTYVGSAGSLILFSQDYLWGADPGQTNWTQGTFAYDILGIGSGEQDIGEPSGDLETFDGGGVINGNYLPLAGIGTIEIDPLENDAYQDHISDNEAYALPCEWQNFESSSIHNSKSAYTDCNTGADLTSEFGSGTVNWRQWSSHWQRDCSAHTAGSCSYKSASATHNNAKMLYADIPATSTMHELSFDYFVSSEATYDILKFSVDGTEIARWSGTMSGWATYYHTLSPGSHTLEWAYVKDGSISSGSDTAWIDNFLICCDTDMIPRSMTHEILSDGNSNYGVAHHVFADADNDGQIDTTTHAAFITLDPVQFNNRYDLETMLLQLIDWSVNRNPIGSTPGGGIHTSERANWLSVGINMTHPTAHTQGGEQWFNLRLFEGQRIRIDSNLYDTPYAPTALSNYDIGHITLFDTDAVSNVGTAVTSDEWTLEYTAGSTGVHQIQVEIVLTGSDQHPNGGLMWPSYRLSIAAISDENDPTLVLNGPSVHDALSPQNWAFSTGGADYSSTAFDLGTLQSGEVYGLTFTSSDDSSSHSLEYALLNFEAIIEYGNFVLESGDSHTQLVQVSSTKQVRLVTSNADSYNHPLLGTFGYDVEFWSIPDDDESDLITGTYQLTEDLEESFWVSSIVDTSDTFTVDVAWDEGMVVEFQSDSTVIGAIAEVSCGTGPSAIVELGMESVIELDCQEPHTTATIVISSNSQLMEYSLLYKRNEATIEVYMDTPMFGINQVDAGSDFWNLLSIAPGQLIDIHSNEAGSIKFYDRQGQVIKTESVDQTTGSIKIPASAKQFSVTDAGDYEFIVFEPNHQSTSISSPDPVLIGEMLTIDVTSSQSHNLDEMLTSDRIYHMWSLDDPTIEFRTPSISEISSSNITHSSLSSFPSVSVESTMSISLNSTDLGVGEHVLTIEIESSWTGLMSHEVSLVVNDLSPNNPPVITGDDELWFKEGDGPVSWTYSVHDIDGDILTVSLVDGPSEIILEPVSDSMVGTGSVMLSWPGPVAGDYVISLEVDDGMDNVSFSTTIHVGEPNIVEEPIDNDKEGDEEEPNQKSDSDEPRTMMVVIGSVAVLIILLVISSMMIIRRKRGDDI